MDSKKINTLNRRLESMTAVNSVLAARVSPDNHDEQIFLDGLEVQSEEKKLACFLATRGFASTVMFISEMR